MLYVSSSAKHKKTIVITKSFMSGFCVSEGVGVLLFVLSVFGPKMLDQAQHDGILDASLHFNFRALTQQHSLFSHLRVLFWSGTPVEDLSSTVVEEVSDQCAGPEKTSETTVLLQVLFCPLKLLCAG
ncbi:hypothetical protein BCT06_13635 [Vibrio breoganii]|nr:hypothetical protein BCT06_13635 [Vibrio breoganii]